MKARTFAMLLTAAVAAVFAAATFPGCATDNDDAKTFDPYGQCMDAYKNALARQVNDPEEPVSADSHTKLINRSARCVTEADQTHFDERECDRVFVEAVDNAINTGTLDKKELERLSGLNRSCIEQVTTPLS